MADRADVRNNVKNIIGRQASGLDTNINTYIDIAVELLTNVVASVYDEAEYEHTVSSADISGNVSSYLLPSETKGIVSGSFIDTSGTEDIWYPIRSISPRDEHSPLKYGAGADTITGGEGSRFDLSSGTITFMPSTSAGRSVQTRVNQTGRPEVMYRIGRNLHVFPRPGSDEENDKIHLVLQVKPDALADDDATNTITTNYPRVLEMLVAGLFYAGYFKDQGNGSFFVSQAATLVSAFAEQDEVNKLQNITLGFSRA